MSPRGAVAGCAAVSVALLSAGLLVAVAAPAVATPPARATAAVAAQPALPPGGSFVAVTPKRVLDTRTTTGRTQSTSVQPLAALSGVNPGDVAAVLLNVTVVGAAGPGYVVVGAGQGTSNGNYVKNAASATLALVRVQTASVPITSSAPANIVVDVQGYVTTRAAATSASYTALDAPRRIVDTRRAVGLTTFTPGQTQSLDVRTRAGLPAAATAVVANLTIAGSTADTYVTGWSGVGARPPVSSVNAPARAVVANRALLPLDASGRIALFDFAGRTDLVVDVVGYTAPDPTGSYYTAVAASRLFDGKTQSTTLSPTVDANAGGTNVLAPAVSDLAPTTSVWLTLVGDQPAGPGYIAARPADVGPTGTSDVNLVPGRAVANSGPVRVSAANGQVVVTSSDPSRVVADLSGWFQQAPAATTPAGSWSGTRYPDYTDRPTRLDTLPTDLPSSFAGGVYTGAGYRTQTNAYAIAADGTVQQSSHLLAQPGRVSPWSAPVRVGPTDATQPGYLAGVTSLATAGNKLAAATYAVDLLGRVWGFQSNTDGELGTTPSNVISYPLVPTRVPLPAGAVATAAFAAQGVGYAVLADGTVYSWGRAGTGQLGRDATTTPWVPAPVTFPGATPTSIAGNARVTFGLDADGATTWWGTTVTGTAQPTPVAYARACATGASLHADYNGVWELCSDGTVVQLSDQGELFATTRTLAISGVTALGAGPGFDGGLRALLTDGRVAAVPSSGPAAYEPFTGVTAINGSPGVQVTLVGG